MRKLFLILAIGLTASMARPAEVIRVQQVYNKSDGTCTSNILFEAFRGYIDSITVDLGTGGTGQFWSVTISNGFDNIAVNTNVSADKVFRPAAQATTVDGSDATNKTRYLILDDVINATVSRIAPTNKTMTNIYTIIYDDK